MSDQSSDSNRDVPHIPKYWTPASIDERTADWQSYGFQSRAEMQRYIDDNLTVTHADGNRQQHEAILDNYWKSCPDCEYDVDEMIRQGAMPQDIDIDKHYDISMWVEDAPSSQYRQDDAPEKKLVGIDVRCPDHDEQYFFFQYTTRVDNQ